MATATTITINDQSAVAHNFAPAQRGLDYINFEDRSSPYYLGYGKISFQLKRPKAPRKGETRSTNLKLIARIMIPKLEDVTNSTISGIAPAPTISYMPACMLECTLPERSALLDRQDLLKYIPGVVVNAQFTTAFQTHEMPN